MRPKWHPKATHRLTTRATMRQLNSWGNEASRNQITLAEFVAIAADFYGIFLKAMRELNTPEDERDAPEPQWGEPWER